MFVVHTCITAQFVCVKYVHLYEAICLCYFQNTLIFVASDEGKCMHARVVLRALISTLYIQRFFLFFFWRGGGGGGVFCFCYKYSVHRMCD